MIVLRRPIELQRCSLCGEEFDKYTMHELFTGRTKYICQGCMNLGNKEIEAKKTEWRQSSRGRQIIEQQTKKHR